MSYYMWADFFLRKRKAVLISLSVEGALERGKLWCLVNHMWKMLRLWRKEMACYL